MTKFLGVLLAAGKGTRMKSDLPKVLHTVNDVPMITKCVQAMEKAGADKIVIVVGYKKELIMKELGDKYFYAVQEEQLGTGHAVMAAEEYIKNYDGNVVIGYGDNPLMNFKTLQEMSMQTDLDAVDGSMLTISLDNPPQAGRVIRDANGNFQEIIEEQDCTESQKNIKEINCGTYCFDSQDLITALKEVRPENNQGEYYLTDVPGILANKGKIIKCVEADDIFDILGVNDQRHREFAETAEAIAYAEKNYGLVDTFKK